LAVIRGRRHKKPVLIRATAGDIWARYPPYTDDKRRFLGLVMRHFPGWVMAFLNGVINPINYLVSSLFSRRG
jgi:hypothetical protein